MDFDNKETVGNIIGTIAFVPYIILFYNLEFHDDLPWWFHIIIWIFGLAIFCCSSISFIEAKKPSQKRQSVLFVLSAFAGLFAALAVNEEVCFYSEPWWKYLVGYVVYMLFVSILAGILNFCIDLWLLINRAGDILDMLAYWKKQGKEKT